MANARTQGEGFLSRSKSQLLLHLPFRLQDGDLQVTTRLPPCGDNNSVTTQRLNYIMAFKGVLYAAAIRVAAARTAGTLTLNILKNGTAFSGTGWTNPVLNATDTITSVKRVLPANRDDFTFVEDDDIGAQVVGSAFTPTTTLNDVHADVYLLVDDLDLGD